MSVRVQVLRNVELMQQYEAQSQQQREMNQELVDLRTNMLGLRKALANELHVRPRLVDDRRSQCSESDTGHDLSAHSSLLGSPRAETASPQIGGGSSRLVAQEKDQDSSIDVVEDTRARLKRLETEADVSGCVVHVCVTAVYVCLLPVILPPVCILYISSSLTFYLSSSPCVRVFSIVRMFCVHIRVSVCFCLLYYITLH